MRRIREKKEKSNPFSLPQLIHKLSKQSSKQLSPSSLVLDLMILSEMNHLIQPIQPADGERSREGEREGEREREKEEEREGYVNEQMIEDLIHYLLIDILKGNGLIRIGMIQLANYYFQKFSLFRKHICQKLTEFLAGAGLFGTPPPTSFSNETQRIILRTIANWDYEYGATYPSLRAMSRYLKESLHLSVPDIHVSVF